MHVEPLLELFVYICIIDQGMYHRPLSLIYITPFLQLMLYQYCLGLELVIYTQDKQA